MINVKDVDVYRNKQYYLRIYELPGNDKEGWQDHFMTKYNQKIYPHFELAAFIWRWFVRLFYPKYNGSNWFNYSAFCSELTCYAMREAGYSGLLFGVDANFIDAIELENIVAKYGTLIESRE